MTARPLTQEEAAALDAPHVVHAVDAQGDYLGLIDRTTAGIAAIAPCAPPASGTWRLVDGRWERILSLAEIKAAKRQQLAAAWQVDTRAGVTIGGKVAPTDPDSWTRYLALKAMAEEASGWVDVPIPLVDGTFEVLTQAKAQALWSALKAMERTLLAKLQAKVSLVAAATTAADVEAVQW